MDQTVRVVGVFAAWAAGVWLEVQKGEPGVDWWLPCEFETILCATFETEPTAADIDTALATTQAWLDGREGRRLLVDSAAVDAAAWGRTFGADETPPARLEPRTGRHLLDVHASRRDARSALLAKGCTVVRERRRATLDPRMGHARHPTCSRTWRGRTPAGPGGRHFGEVPPI